MVTLIVFGVLALALIAFFVFTSPEQREGWKAEGDATKAAKRRDAILTEHAKNKAKRPLSEIGARTLTGELACPKCGGTSFKARRSKRGRATIIGTGVATGGLGALAGVAATRRGQVECQTCGVLYTRG